MQSFLLHCHAADLVLPGSVLKGILLPGITDEAVLLLPQRVFLRDHLNSRPVGGAVLAHEEAALHPFVLLRGTPVAQEALPRCGRVGQDELRLPRSTTSGYASLPGETEKARRRVTVENGAGDQHGPDAAGVRSASAFRTNHQKGRHPVQTIPGQSREQAHQGALDPEGIVARQQPKRHQQQQQLPKYLQSERRQGPRLRSRAQLEAADILEDSSEPVHRVPAGQERVR